MLSVASSRVLAQIAGAESGEWLLDQSLHSLVQLFKRVHSSSVT